AFRVKGACSLAGFVGGAPRSWFKGAGGWYPPLQGLFVAETKVKGAGVRPYSERQLQRLRQGYAVDKWAAGKATKI
ncbi:MAG: hypothetical protein RR873_02985, partial [Christensenella sp.]